MVFYILEKLFHFEENTKAHVFLLKFSAKVLQFFFFFFFFFFEIVRETEKL